MSMPTSSEMMAITTSNSMSVKPRREREKDRCAMPISRIDESVGVADDTEF